MDQLFENFWFELLKSFVYGVVLAALGHVAVTFWRSLKGEMAAIPRLRQQLAELFKLQRDGETGHAAFGPWLITRDLIRIAIFVSAIAAVGLIVSEILMMVVTSDQTLRRLDQWGTITLRTTPIPVPVFAVAFLAAFFLNYVRATGRVIGAATVFIFGAAIVACFALAIRWAPFQTEGQYDFRMLHEFLGGLTLTSLSFGEGNWFLPLLHLSVPAVALIISLMLTFAVVRRSMTLLPDIWRHALRGSRALGFGIWLIGAFSATGLYFMMRVHSDWISNLFGYMDGRTSMPNLVIFLVATLIVLWLSGRRANQSSSWIT